MVDVFKKLPAECTPGISLAERDSLIKYGTYVIPGGDSIETTRYEISSINANDYLNYYFNFITGQRAFIDFELRKYYATPESGIIVFSEYGGLPSNYSQHDLRLFRFDKNGFTEILNQKLLPKKISVTKFLKKETSDSIIRKIENYSNFCFNLETSDPNTLEFILDCKDVEGEIGRAHV